MSKEKSNFVVYEKVLRSLDQTVYVGMGSLERANRKNYDNEELQKLFNDGLIETKIVHENLTEGEAKRIEALLIAKHGIDHLYNETIGTKGYEDDKLDEDDVKTIYKTGIDQLIEVVKMSSIDFTIKDRATPVAIGNEIIDTILNSRGFSVDGKKILNPNSRSGELFKQISDRVGIDAIKNNFTMIESDIAKIQVFLSNGNMNGAKMQDIIFVNEDFDKWETTERYDVIIMNPPFVGVGEKFIKKCMALLKDKGFLGCVMSPTWRSVSSRSGNQRSKTYTKMLEEGGFHYIHMYSSDDTTKAFNKAIGQVDTFVWQKGVKIDNTKIINLNGDEFYYDLNNYPQTPPVLPSYIYDKLFDQVNGLKWDVWTNPRNKTYGPADIEFVDALSNKDCMCNSTTVEKTKGKKVMADEEFSRYYTDNIGNEISASHYTFYFNTDDERDVIIKLINNLIDNNLTYLFKNRSSKIHTFIPGIRING